MPDSIFSLNARDRSDFFQAAVARAYNSRFGTSKEITDKCGEIIEIAGSINE